MQRRTIRQVWQGAGAAWITLLILASGCNSNRAETAADSSSSISSESSGPEVVSQSATGVPQIKHPADAPTIGEVSVIDGTTTSLEKLRGKVVILDFWATWCGPCRTTIPFLKELDTKYSKDGLVVLGISEESQETVKPFVNRMGMDYTVVADPFAGGTWHVNYHVESLPTVAVIDRKGKLRMYETGVERTPGHSTHDRLSEIIPQLLAEKE